MMQVDPKPNNGEKKMLSQFQILYENERSPQFGMLNTMQWVLMVLQYKLSNITIYI